MPEYDFNVSDAPPGGNDFDPIPDGWYRCIVEAIDDKTTKDGTGRYFAVQLAVCEGKYENRRLFDNLNIVNRNEQAVAIAKRQLAALIQACGKTAIRRTEELHAIPILVKVGTRPARDGFDAQNTIKGYKPTEAAQAFQQAPTQQAPKPGPAPQGAPW